MKDRKARNNERRKALTAARRLQDSCDPGDEALMQAAAEEESRAVKATLYCIPSLSDLFQLCCSVRAPRPNTASLNLFKL